MNIKWVTGISTHLSTTVSAGIMFFLFAASANAEGLTKYTHNFTGSGTSGLNDKNPDFTNYEADPWAASAAYKADGSFSFSSTSSTNGRAFLPITIVPGKVYKLEVTGTLTSGGASQSFGVGFTSDRGSIDDDFYTAGRCMAAMILRNSGTVDCYANADNGSSLTTLPSHGGYTRQETLTIVLTTHTDGIKWTADYYVGDIHLNTYTWDVAPTITQVAIATGTSTGGLGGAFKRFNLSEMPSRFAYSHSFTGSGTSALNGKTPDVTSGTAAWTASTAYKADGSFSFSSTSSTSGRASLPVTIVPGKVYKLEVTGTLTSGQSAQSFGVGFTSDRGGVDDNLNTAARCMAAIILRNSGTVDCYANADNGSTLTTLTSSGTHTHKETLTIVLTTYTDSTKWTADYYVGDTHLNTYTWTGTQTPIITRVAIATGTSNGGLVGAFKGFKLTEISSALAYMGPGASALVYGKYQNYEDPEVIPDNQLPDFSYAGYKGGGVPIPDITTTGSSISVGLPQAGEDPLDKIQNAINTVSSWTPDANGFRGAVILASGTYTVRQTIKISTDGVVLRGQGQGENGGTTITHTQGGPGTFWAAVTSGTLPQKSLIEVGGDLDWSRVNNGNLSGVVADSWVPTGTNAVRLTTANSVLATGTTVIVRMNMKQAWIDDLGMKYSGTNLWSVGFQLEYERVIKTNVSGTNLTFDVPLVQSILARHTSVDVIRTTRPRIQNCGVENLRLISPYDASIVDDENNACDENHAWYAVHLNTVENSWVRNVTALHFVFTCVTMDRCKNCTVQDCAYLEPISQIHGGRRYAFHFSGNQTLLCLVQRCYSSYGRHDFVTGSQTPGPNVFLDCLAVHGLSDIGPHQRYATGILYDNVRTEHEMGVLNMTAREPTNDHGWRGAQCVYWNGEAGDIMDIDSAPGSMNFFIGCITPAIDHRDGGTYIEESGPTGTGTHVAPRSLYIQQLRDRLGSGAVNSVINSHQADGTIMSFLQNWAGGWTP